MKRYSDAERKWILEEFTASGLSLAAFCRREGLCYATVSGWRKRGEGSPAQTGGGVTLVELQSDDQPGEATGAGQVEVVLPGGGRVCFAAGVSVVDVARFCRELWG